MFSDERAALGIATIGDAITGVVFPSAHLDTPLTLSDAGDAARGLGMSDGTNHRASLLLGHKRLTIAEIRWTGQSPAAVRARK